MSDVRTRSNSGRQRRAGKVRRERQTADLSWSRLIRQGTGSAWVAQLVERVLGKDEVSGSIPVPGSRLHGVR